MHTKLCHDKIVTHCQCNMYMEGTKWFCLYLTRLLSKYLMGYPQEVGKEKPIHLGFQVLLALLAKKFNFKGEGIFMNKVGSPVLRNFWSILNGAFKLQAFYFSCCCLFENFQIRYSFFIHSWFNILETCFHLIRTFLKSLSWLSNLASLLIAVSCSCCILLE